jgi:transcriptional regulator
MSEAELALHLDAISAKFESWLAPKPPWRTAEVSSGRRAAMRQAIIGLVMAVDDVEGSFKLNQHKSDVDHLAVTVALEQQSDAAAQQLARTMRAMRPQAFAADMAALNDTATPEGSA